MSLKEKKGHSYLLWFRKFQLAIFYSEQYAGYVLHEPSSWKELIQSVRNPRNLGLHNHYFLQRTVYFLYLHTDLDNIFDARVRVLSHLLQSKIRHFSLSLTWLIYQSTWSMWPDTWRVTQLQISDTVTVILSYFGQVQKLFWSSTKLPLNWRKPENSHLLR